MHAPVAESGNFRRALRLKLIALTLDSDRVQQRFQSIRRCLRNGSIESSVVDTGHEEFKVYWAMNRGKEEEVEISWISNAVSYQK